MIAASAIGLGAAMFAGAASAEVPALITHQGRLFDAKDQPVSGTIPVVFTIYRMISDLDLCTYKHGHHGADDRP
jgi:hypothetical protein